MRHTVFNTTIAALILSISFISCDNAVQKDDDQNRGDRIEARDNTGTAENEYRQDVAPDRDDFERRAERNNERITELRNEVDNTERDNTATTDQEDHRERTQRIEELEEQNRDLETRLENFQEDGEESWEEFKADFNREMEKLESEIEELGDEMDGTASN